MPTSSPPPHELPVPLAGGDQVVRDREVDGRLGARLRRQPNVGARGGVRQARVERDDLAALVLRLNDPLCVRIEIVPRFEMRQQKKNECGVCMVRAGRIIGMPARVAKPRSGRADTALRTPRESRGQRRESTHTIRRVPPFCPCVKQWVTCR